MSFKRTVEDFTCEHCGVFVKGDGYTNHCPKCLWSKHVDVNPGDRREACGCLMRPVRIEGSTPNYSIVHECTACKKHIRNTIGKEDSVDTLLHFAESVAAGRDLKLKDNPASEQGKARKGD